MLSRRIEMKRNENIIWLSAQELFLQLSWSLVLAKFSN